MRHLCDVNVFLAAVVEDHPHHVPAKSWLDSLTSDDTAEFCRVTQAALLRLLTNTAILKDNAVSNQEAIALYLALAKDSRIKFQEEPTNLEDFWFRDAAVETRSPNLSMDAYLAAFARKLGMRLVTFDEGFRRYRNIDLLMISRDTPEAYS